MFNKIMSEVLPYLNVPKTETEDEASRAKGNKKSADENYDGNIIEGENSGIVDNDGNYGGGAENQGEKKNEQGENQGNAGEGEVEHNPDPVQGE